MPLCGVVAALGNYRCNTALHHGRLTDHGRQARLKGLLQGADDLAR